MKKELIKSIKKLHLTKNDLLIVTLKGNPSDYHIDKVKKVLLEMNLDIMGLNTKVLVSNEEVNFKKGKPHQGKHIVYLNNLEYLEYLNNKKVLDK